MSKSAIDTGQPVRYGPPGVRFPVGAIAYTRLLPVEDRPEIPKLPSVCADTFGVPLYSSSAPTTTSGEPGAVQRADRGRVDQRRPLADSDFPA